ncbi:hypothetical protein M3I53_14750 [Paraburkholderia sp. CNPSo 3272]|uniref:hypothetical protein n=1 Tax=Paraburkholderia sp. CNPSo 3272 TaxID=2940931 RepID=UPI0020B88A3E|nr:hypothetical protein [Paraburkholderia sp. CNPSo 3272]MCP3724373.1 hypothetical protein [Paraburkholderia sp. CNPSo 3272]
MTARAQAAGAIAGIYPILYAFFDRDNRLDRAAMRRQVEAAVRGGAPGIAVLKPRGDSRGSWARSPDHRACRWGTPSLVATLS